MLILIEILTICFVTILLRLVFLSNKNITNVLDGDALTQLWNIDAYATTNSLSNRNYSGAIYPSYLGYPPLLHIIIAKFPRKYWLLFYRTINILFDVCSTIVVYFYLQLLAPVELTQNLSTSFWGAMLFMTTPLFSPINARLVSLGARTFGTLLFLLFIGSLWGLIVTGNIWMLIPVFILINLIVLSSQFALQAVFLTSFFLSIILLNPIPILCLIISLTVGSLIPKLNIWLQIKTRYYHMRWYTKIDNNYINNRNNFKLILQHLKNFKNKPIKSIQYLTSKVTPVVLVLGFPLLVLFVSLHFTSFFWELYNESMVYKFLIALSWSGILSFVLTSFKPFTIIGEAERYIEYSIPSILIGTILLIGSNEYLQTICILLVFINLGLLIFNMMFNRLDIVFSNIVTPQITTIENVELKQLIDFLLNAPYRRMVCIHMKLGHPLRYYLPNDYKFYLFVFDHKLGFDYNIEDSYSYGIMKLDLDVYKNKYNADALIFEKEYTYLYKDKDEFKTLQSNDIAFENKDFIIYKIN